MIKFSIFNLFSLLSGFMVAVIAYGSNVTEDVYGNVAVRPSSDGVLYNNTVEIFRFSYMPSITEPGYNTPYCSVSSVIIRGLNCDDSSQSSSSYVTVLNGTRYDNREQDGKFLSCNASSQGGNIYEMTFLHESPVSSIQHHMLVDMGTTYPPGTIIEYTGVNNYYSISTGEYESETYMPLEETSDNSGYSNIPLNCKNLLVPVIP